MLEQASESVLRPLSRLDPELQIATWELVKVLEERPSGRTISQTVGMNRLATEEGWQEREHVTSETQSRGGGGTAPISSRRNGTPGSQNGDGRNGRGTSHQPRMSGLLQGLVRWAAKVEAWNAEAIVAADDEICLERHMRAARTLNQFCVALITACNERRSQRRAQ
jgi:hypothetical protein